MKSLVCTIMLCLSISSVFGYDILRPEQRSFINNVEYIGKKDLKTIPGKAIIYKYRGGKLHSVFTQDCFKVTGKINFNPLERKFTIATNKLDLATIQANMWSNYCAIAQMNYLAMSNSWARAQMNFEKLKKKNDEASEDLENLAKEHPLLGAIIRAIKAKIQVIGDKLDGNEN